MDTTSCQYAASNCTPSHTLPFTGLEVVAVIGFAVACLALGLLIRFSHRSDA